VPKQGMFEKDFFLFNNSKKLQEETKKNKKDVKISGVD